LKRIARVVIFLLVVFIVAVFALSNFYTDFLWFSNLGFQSVYITGIVARIGIVIASFLIFYVFVYINLILTRKAVISFIDRFSENEFIHIPFGGLLTRKRIGLGIAIAAAVLSGLFSTFTGPYWLTVLQYLNRAPFGVNDPIFNKDAGFYVFTLPIYELINQYIMTLLIITALAVGLIYFLTNPMRRTERGWNLLPEGNKHVSILLSLIFINKAWGYLLQSYNLVYSPRGVAFGASYTDMHAQLPGYRVLFVITLVLAGLLLVNTLFKKPRLIIYTLVSLIGASILLGSVYPSVIQRLRVEPNEYNREKPYIEHNIKFTQIAFGLDKVERTTFPAEQNLSFEDVEANPGTFENIRLWDYRAAQQTYSQLQEIRPYYKFNQLDTDRYTIDGRYRQVLLAPRELDQTKISTGAQNWLNQRLQYTHGYGVVMNPMNEVTSERLPRLFLKDIPPKSIVDIEVERPEIYYGELTNDYVIVKTKAQEFDYPKGETNAYTTYEGNGGVPVGSFLRRIMFALRFGDYRMLLSGNITGESRVMFNRNIAQRVEKIAPFLRFDKDPYLVVSDGKLYWMHDAYTVTNRYPYSEPFQGINYIRNPVKIVTDAYNGSVSFYAIDPDEPILKSLAGVFPALFKPFDAMPEDLKKHIRYPEDLFDIQASVYLTYHMNDSRVFYNKEDRWQIPNEIYAGETVPVESYYTILQLPGEDEPEYILMQPYSPITKNVMIAWMAGRSDGDNYGKLMLFMFPKEKQVYGPSQIEARIDQNPIISQQLTLWSQRGSQIIRGNLLVLPIKDSILYVEPLFLQAQQSQFPELVRVIAAYGETVVMEPTLGEALAAVFREEPPAQQEQHEQREQQERPEQEPATMKELIEKANQLFETAQGRLKEGDWAGYGEAINELEMVLNQMRQGEEP
jgi:uncharacterized membrane protein (UPF0182 family)